MISKYADLLSHDNGNANLLKGSGEYAGHRSFAVGDRVKRD